MSLASIFRSDFAALAASDTVGTAIAAMLRHGVTDLPVVDSVGTLRGLLKLERVFASLLPKAALIGHGMTDLGFVTNTLDELRTHMRDVEHHPVTAYVVPFAHTVTAETSPMELVLLLVRGANSVPVVDRDNRLLGMVSARDLLHALHQDA